MSRRSKIRALPAFKDWDWFAGGTGAAEGKRGYGVSSTSGLRYSISPYTTKYGRHAGYMLTVHPSMDKTRATAWISPTGAEAGHPAPASYRSPQAAVKAAKAHAEHDWHVTGVCPACGVGAISAGECKACGERP